VRTESSLLGALLIDPTAFEDVTPIVTEECFEHGVARTIFRAMRDLHEWGRVADFATLSDELERRGELDTVGRGVLSEIVNRCPTSLHAVDYAKALRQRALDRQLEVKDGPVEVLSRAVWDAVNHNRSLFGSQVRIDARKNRDGRVTGATVTVELPKEQ